MKYLSHDEWYSVNNDLVKVQIAGVNNKRECIVMFKTTKNHWQNQGDGKYLHALVSETSTPKISYENLSIYTRKLIEKSVYKNSDSIFVPENEIREFAHRKGQTFDDALKSIEKDISDASKQGIDLGVEYKNHQFSIPYIVKIDFPLGFAENMGIANQEEYANVGELYQKRNDEEIADDITTVLMRGMPSSDMGYHIASVIADEAVDRLRSESDVESAVEGVIKDMSYGCNSGSITEMIYSNDIDKFFETYKDDIQSVVSFSDVPDKEDWAKDGWETKQWMAKTAYETMVFMFDDSRRRNIYALQEIELYEEKNIKRNENKTIVIEQCRGIEKKM